MKRPHACKPLPNFGPAAARSFMLSACGAGVALLAGCEGASYAVKDPEQITLQSALADVGEGLNKMVENQAAGNDFGLYPSEVIVTFAISAGGASNASLVVQPSFGSGMDPRIAGSLSSTQTAERANTVSIKFTNLLFAPDTTLASKKTGAEFFELRQAIMGIDPRQTMVPTRVEVTNSEGTTTFPAVGTTPEGSAVPVAEGTAPEGTAPVAAPPTKPIETAQAPPPPKGMPAMKFLSPYANPNDDPTDFIKSLDAKQLATLATKLNGQVGVKIVDPNAPTEEVRSSLQSATKALKLTKGAVEKMLK